MMKQQHRSKPSKTANYNKVKQIAPLCSVFKMASKTGVIPK